MVLFNSNSEFKSKALIIKRLLLYFKRIKRLGQRNDLFDLDIKVLSK